MEQSVPDRSIGLAGYLSGAQESFTRVLVRGQKLLGAATARGMKADLGIVGAFPQRATIRVMLQEFFAMTETARLLAQAVTQAFHSVSNVQADSHILFISRYLMHLNDWAHLYDLNISP